MQVRSTESKFYMSQNALQRTRSSRDRNTIGQENGVSILNEAHVICHSAKVPAGLTESGARPPITTTAPRRKDSETLSDLDRALLEASEELDFDWPEFLPVERVIRGITEIALGCALVAGVAVFWCFVWSDCLKR